MNKKNRSVNNETAFTLIEILVAIAIVAILSTVVLISLGSFRSKARSTKALTSLSSAIPSMVSCWGNGGGVNDPASGTDICDLATTYGKWPTVSEDLGSYGYGDIAIDNTDDRSHAWAFSLSSDDDDRKICCNSTMNSCKILDAADGSCSADDPVN